MHGQQNIKKNPILINNVTDTSINVKSKTGEKASVTNEKHGTELGAVTSWCVCLAVIQLNGNRHTLFDNGLSFHSI